MKNQTDVENEKLKKVAVLLITIVAIELLFELGMLNNVNNVNVNKTLQVLVNQVVDVIENNRQREDELTKSLKEDYIIRAKAVAYMINAKKNVEYNVSELKKIAQLTEVDEIHLFDASGRIYSGTVPEYYGYSFDSGEQIGYFKPMLTDKALVMCQNVLPNTLEGKQMMYAITWDETGEKMIQIGIKPTRLLKELKQDEISTVISNMPVYDGVSIYVADESSGEICGATDKSKIGQTLKSIGIMPPSTDRKEAITDRQRVDGKRCACIFRRTGNYIIGVTFATSFNRASSYVAMGAMTVYLGFAMAGIIIVVSRMLKLTSKSNMDELTGCFNRRAYEEDARKIFQRDDFIYISADVNGLKEVNDNLGHSAGDELIQGAAFCLKQSFDRYGKIYRIGGDEFVAVLFIREQQFAPIKEAFEKLAEQWVGQHREKMTISYGYVSSKERKWDSLYEISKAADERMYEMKEAYYKRNGIDRKNQQIAYRALCRLYTKILKINLTRDCFQIINLTQDEQDLLKNSLDKISVWLHDFGQAGIIHPDDLQQYFEKTDIKYMQSYFKCRKGFLDITYRRKRGQRYEHTVMKIIPADDYSDEEQTCFLYVASIDG